MNTSGKSQDPILVQEPILIAEPNSNTKIEENQNKNASYINYNYNVNEPLDLPIDKSDIEQGGVTATIHQRMRLGFIRKTYGILSLQLVFTAIFVAFTFMPQVNNFLFKNIGLFYIALITNMTILISMICFPHLLRTVPTNYLLLSIWTACEAYMVGTVSAFYPPEIVMTAAALTAAVSVSLTVYAMYTKTDFTILGGFLFTFTLIMICWGLMIMIFGFFLYTLYCVLGVILFSIYLIFDTQLIMGKFGLEYSVDDYILASINIYIDIIQIFLYLLSILRNDN